MRAPDAPAPRVGERFSRRVTFDAASIRRFAAMSGDENPLHHDDAIAAVGPFGRLIASGTQVTALMMGLDATYFSRRFEALGLSFDFRFHKAIPADTTLVLEWAISACTPKESLGGIIVEVEGRALDDAGTVYATGRGANLIRTRAQAQEASNMSAGAKG
jgi:acyl dehydratase